MYQSPPDSDQLAIDLEVAALVRLERRLTNRFMRFHRRATWRSLIVFWIVFIVGLIEQVENLVHRDWLSAASAPVGFLLSLPVASVLVRRPGFALACIRIWMVLVLLANFGMHWAPQLYATLWAYPAWKTCAGAMLGLWFWVISDPEVSG